MLFGGTGIINVFRHPALLMQIEDWLGVSTLVREFVAGAELGIDVQFWGEMPSPAAEQEKTIETVIVEARILVVSPHIVRRMFACAAA